jgi:hypothetical protein
MVSNIFDSILAPLRYKHVAKYEIVPRFCLEAQEKGYGDRAAEQLRNPDVAKYMGTFLWYTEALRKYWHLPTDAQRQFLSGTVFAFVKLCDEAMETNIKSQDAYFIQMVDERLKHKSSLRPQFKGLEFLIDKVNELSHDDKNLHELISKLGRAGKAEKEFSTFSEYLTARKNSGSACGDLAYYVSVNPDEHYESNRALSMKMGEYGNILDTFVDWSEDKKNGIINFPMQDRLRLLAPLAANGVQFLQHTGMAALPLVYGALGNYLKPAFNGKGEFVTIKAS